MTAPKAQDAARRRLDELAPLQGARGLCAFPQGGARALAGPGLEHPHTFGLPDQMFQLEPAPLRSVVVRSKQLCRAVLHWPWA